MEIYRAKFGPDTRFFFASDDHEWVNQHFDSYPDVLPTNKCWQFHPDTVSLDMAVLSMCNHSIYR